ncbi:hypothetical protein [Stenotrophomonas sp. 24(2023)]|uniref:hypothetical protein n=1 Tax=Stenotrophomonas sp. 24(2023) TaxID=3068324 RepID=UPI0027DF2CE4|nr:hypothetical protein [Stenotrophomonas sp. 24(2023)]WMJ70405.1 hypothetical protein Q9R17_04695 [Stenotrophomonas sp. 24(2023)]
MVRPSARVLMACLVLALPATQAAPAYVDARLYPSQAAGWERFRAVERALVRGFDNVCGDTFCEGEYYNLRPLRLRCSVQAVTGVLAGCLWTFTGSNAGVERRSGRITVDVRHYACALPLAAGTTLEALLQALEAAPPGEALDVPLPGTRQTVYDGLVDCL